MPALQEFHHSTLYLIRAETAVSIKDGQLWLGKNWEKMLLVDGFDGS
ncbi:MAG: hypothetical protein ACK6A9_04230 [Dolichospermum sp.]|jgi:hypothetical protein|nr:hypothetical protein [Anabaena sp. 49628_E55]